MATIEKAGMLVNGDKEVVGWVNAGDVVEMKEGDVVVSHFKTAEKMGLKAEFDSMKAENKPKKEKAEKAEGDKAPRVRTDVPETGPYTVLKPGYANDHANPDCAAVYTLLTSNTDFGTFFQNAKAYNHIKRDGTAGGEVTPKAVAAYAIRRGVIQVG